MNNYALLYSRRLSQSHFRYDNFILIKSKKFPNGINFNFLNRLQIKYNTYHISSKL